jgi:5,5'-dehydrodivanillate O-demethylase
MLTAEHNEQMSRVGSGTSMGELMRRYWHPVAAGVDLNTKTPTKAVRLLGEDLTLFRTMKGELGLVARRCAHRGTNLVQGIQEPDGIRCAYHGWMFDAAGQCIEMPNEPNPTFKDKISITAYDVQELGGVVLTWGSDPGCKARSARRTHLARSGRR